MASNSGPRASEIAERLVKQLNVTFKAVRLYPPSSAIPRESAMAVLATLRVMLRSDPDVRLTVTKEGLFHEDGVVHPGQEAFADFAREFFGRRLAEVRFHTGVTVKEIIKFFRVLDLPRREFTGSESFETRLWDANVVNITVKEASTRIVDHIGPKEGAKEAPEGWPPTARTIDEILAEMSAGRPRDQIVLVRVVESPKAIGAYLRKAVKGRGTTPPTSWVTSRVGALAHAMSSMGGEGRGGRLQAIADALMELDEEVLREVLTERMLPESRHDEDLAEITRRIGLDRICSVLASGFEDTEKSRDELTRVFRNLIHISDTGREKVLGVAGAALEEMGVDRTTIASVLAGAAPGHITIRRPDRREEPSPVERIVRLVDMSPVGQGTVGDDEAFAGLRREARLGISDGDVLGALVTLISIEHRDDRFSSIMSIVEDGLDLLVMRQEYKVAASVTDSLLRALDDDSRSKEQKTRIQAALDVLSAKTNVRAIAAAMRRHEAGTDEHEACRHLLAALGRHRLGPLLEVLADEPDMTARKIIVEIVSEMAEAHLEDLGGRLSDERWYFVRNIVTILSATRSPATLTLLGRTLRYPDPRVRRETIRAVSAIRGALAVEMLVAALEDPDTQNVQLAARYLGLMGTVSAVDDLERVAAGEGTGNRGIPARIEAIEAVGRLGSRGSLPLLRSLTRTRRLVGRARVREMAVAAAAAMRAIERRIGAQEGRTDR